jgi:hypothetical protein
MSASGGRLRFWNADRDGIFYGVVSWRRELRQGSRAKTALAPIPMTRFELS